MEGYLVCLTEGWEVTEVATGDLHPNGDQEEEEVPLLKHIHTYIQIHTHLLIEHDMMSTQACLISSQNTTRTGDSTVDTKALARATVAVVVVETATIETRDDTPPPHPLPPVVGIHHHTYIMISVSLLKIMRMIVIAMILISTTVEIALGPIEVVVSEKAEMMMTAMAPMGATIMAVAVAVVMGMRTIQIETALTRDPTLLGRRRSDLTEIRTEIERRRRRKTRGTAKGKSKRRYVLGYVCMYGGP